jgi:hypothetical protein
VPISPPPPDAEGQALADDICALRHSYKTTNAEEWGEGEYGSEVGRAGGVFAMTGTQAPLSSVLHYKKMSKPKKLSKPWVCPACHK